MRVYLAGEGKTDLGSWAREAMYRPSDPRAVDDGVIVALLEATIGARFAVVGAILWKKIPTLRRGGDIGTAEAQHVVAAAQFAVEAGAHALVFVRDRDRSEAREQGIRGGVEVARQRFPALGIVGDVAIEELEAWLLALHGEVRSESHANAKAVLAVRLGLRTREEKVAAIRREAGRMSRLPPDAISFRRWVNRVREIGSGG